MNKVRDILKKINIAGSIGFNTPLKDHTSFKVGGPADAFAVPVCVDDIDLLTHACRINGIPLFFLGEGANILVSDRGIRGLVVNMKAFDDISIEGTVVKAGAGAAMSTVAEAAAEASLSGLCFIYGMPGSVGGSVYMNARCYNSEVADVLLSATIMLQDGTIEIAAPARSEYSYKRSPFQNSSVAILSASFNCRDGKRDLLIEEMTRYKEDRKGKGHYRFPSVGSVFKNNRRFGEPTGKIIDKCGLKGYCIGGAQVAEYHGNIIINRDSASAGDIYDLILHVEQTVKEKTGFILEREVILAGDWRERCSHD